MTDDVLRERIDALLDRFIIMEVIPSVEFGSKDLELKIILREKEE